MHKFSPGTRERVSSQKLQVFSRTHVLYCMLIRRDPHTRDFPAKIPHGGPPPTPDDGWRARVRSGTLPRGHSRLPTGTHSIAFACARFHRTHYSRRRIAVAAVARTGAFGRSSARDRGVRETSSATVIGAEYSRRRSRRSGARCARCAVGYMIGGKKHASLRIDARARGRSRDDAGADVDRVDGIRTRMWIARGLEAMGQCM